MLKLLIQKAEIIKTEEVKNAETGSILSNLYNSNNFNYYNSCLVNKTSLPIQINQIKN